MILASYKEFEERVGIIENAHGSKSERVEAAILRMIGSFSKADLKDKCPDVSEPTINRVLAKLKEEGSISPTGKGRSARWIVH